MPSSTTASCRLESRSCRSPSRPIPCFAGYAKCWTPAGPDALLLPLRQLDPCEQLLGDAEGDAELFVIRQGREPLPLRILGAKDALPHLGNRALGRLVLSHRPSGKRPIFRTARVFGGCHPASRDRAGSSKIREGDERAACPWHARVAARSPRDVPA